MFPKCIDELIDSFKKFPGVGQKSAERMAFSLLYDFDEDDAEKFSFNISNVKNSIKNCDICNCITDQDLCFVCTDKGRDKSILIVVENSKDVFLLEKMGNFSGYYHVLGGLISPFDDIGPDDIDLKGLFDRVKKDKVKEIIFVTKSGIEADTTILYIKKCLSDVDVVISRVANGIPVGADMDYIDSLTLESALKNRKEVLD